MSLPIVMTSAGLQPQSPTSLNQQIIAGAVALDPGLTANLPGTLIEDIASTDTGALVLIDSAQVETVNSMTPYGANLFILNQLGQIYGVQQGLGTNVSVYLKFSGTPGFVINAGVLVSDGTYQYLTQEASVIQSGGTSNSVYAVATISGSWAVPAGTVTNILSSIPTGITLTVTNPTTGIPSSGVQSPDDYRSQVLNAGLTSCSSTITAIKTYLQRVPGVISSLISVRQSGSKWEVIVGGGDPTAVADAIFQSCGDPSSLTGSVMSVTGVTTGSTTTITTNLVTGFTIGESITIAGTTGLTGVDGAHTITALPDPFSFTFGTSSSGTWTGGGSVTVGSTGTIPRNQSVTIYDTPDSYVIPFVTPVQQPVLVQISWKTSSTNTISNTAVQTLSAPAIVSYINSLGPGQPINEYELQYVFQESINSVVPTPLLTYISIQITLNGVITPVVTGTGIVVGDPEGYYFIGTSGVTTVKL